VSNKPMLPEPEYWLEGTDVANYSAADMQSILEQGIAYGREQMREECIKLIADESVRVLATQNKKEDTAMNYSINLQTRMTCVLFPGIIDAIKELP